MRVLVTGGRKKPPPPNEIHRILYPIHQRTPIAILGHGNAYGIDELCKLWALNLGIPTAEYDVEPRDWILYGDRAGNMRNSRMLRDFKPDIGVAFPGGGGTADMRTKMIAAGLKTIVGTYADTTRTTIKWRLENGSDNG